MTFNPLVHGVLGPDCGRIEDVAEPVKGYRWWNIKPDGEGGLYSINYYSRFPWPSTGIEAECGYLPWFLARFLGRRPPCPMHRRLLARTPERGPLCGVYAFRTPELAYRKWHGHVLGEVLLGGRIVPHDHGYRAEKARISKLISTSPYRGSDVDAQMELASRRYDIPIEFINGSQLFEDHWKGRNSDG